VPANTGRSPCCACGFRRVTEVTDPLLTQITAQFGSFIVEKSRGGYTISDRRSQAAIARLRPLTGTDRFELLYWPAVRDRWRTFGNLGVMKLRLMDAYEIVSNDPIFQICGSVPCEGTRWNEFEVKTGLSGLASFIVPGWGRNWPVIWEMSGKLPLLRAIGRYDGG
jgi:hypothetical protein